LYCQAGSLSKLIDAWRKLVGTEANRIKAGEFGVNLGKPIAFRYAETWCSRFHWVARKRLWESEQLAELESVLNESMRMKKHKLMRLFDTALDKVQKDLEGNAIITTADLKRIWEMSTTETGGATSKSEVAITDQRPLSPAERETASKIDEIIKAELSKQKGSDDQNTGGDHPPQKQNPAGR